ncbi:3-phosphoserine/phosphohydroxythreonine transaminase [Paenibacillus alkalitolerans]|uniref:3-phosphoserine/phosphohydroxythreonine transaminase n=1 Tax=Paenibacillus alkalitolerans TaxID=2799335 RepID=UPI0018F75E4C|nr:3-phosphoserine/phosphohydroxythreonine transaminase [Paenibacillus alkalitolerans]
MIYRINNFNPGPAALPLEVLQEAQKEFVEYGGRGMSVMEMSHRSKDVERLNEETQQLLLEILGLPPGYRILFMGGGASTQFALVPLNFLKSGTVGRYIVSGSFSEKAYMEAITVGKAEIIASSKAHNWRRLPDLNDVQLGADTAYVHMTTNNTIEGSQFRALPATGQVPLIGDMTSDILSRRFDYTKFSMFYASAQKNLGCAGVTVAVIREEMLKECPERIPAIFRYSTFVQHNSLYNTPPVHSVYMMKLVLEWVKRQGGVAELEKRNIEKANLLYDVIDVSGGFYRGFIEKPYRSLMNITWRMSDVELEKRFVQESERNGFDGLAGHRSVGGLRASAYNAVSVESCRALADFMIDFQKRNG